MPPDVDDSRDHTLPIRRVSGRRSLADDCAKHRVPMSGIARALVCGVSLCAMALLSAAAFAHTGSGTGGFVGGFEHPLFGPDHVAAMLAVGLWGAFLGPPAIWLLPIVFPLVMACGGVAGIIGVALPGVEIGIAIS